jgi:hypothetical protein
MAVSYGNDEQNQDGQGENEVQNGSNQEYENAENYFDQSNSSGQQPSNTVAVVSSSNSEYDPYSSFEIQHCDTYSKLWIFDLEASCNDGNCRCTFAQQLVSQKRLSCSDVSSCPTDCPICLQCLRQVCDAVVVDSAVLSAGRKSLPAVISLITLLLAGCLVFSRKSHKDGELEESLMETESGGSDPGDWMVPVNSETGLPAEEGKICKPVWLAPATFPEPQATAPSPGKARDKRDRKETVMLVVVPKPSLTATSSSPLTKSSPDVEKGNNSSIFPDLLKDSTGSEATKDANTPATESYSPPSDVVSNNQGGKEEFSPGLWVVPLSNESVASSISASMDHTDSTDDDDDLSNTTPSTGKDAEETDSGKEEHRSADKSTERQCVIIDGSRTNILQSTCTESTLECHSISSTVTDSSTISTLDGERSIGSWEGEI